MTVLTKQDLQDWNSHPVTQAILKQIDAQLVELRAESTLRPTADETAMATAKNEGIAEGADSLLHAYYLILEDAE
tara:strand:+ start:332 stop:556 length:225 start_codon:yes stop_codon:yes gene_type:complete